MLRLLAIIVMLLWSVPGAASVLMVVDECAAECPCEDDGDCPISCQLCSAAPRIAQPVLYEASPPLATVAHPPALPAPIDACPAGHSPGVFHPPKLS